MSKKVRVYLLIISLFLVGLVYWGAWVIQVQNETRQAEKLRLQQQEIERLKNDLQKDKQEQEVPVAPDSTQSQSNSQAAKVPPQAGASSKPECANKVKDIHARYSRSLGAIHSDYRRSLHSIQNDKGSEKNKGQATARLRDVANRSMDKAYSDYLSEIRSANCGSAPHGPPQHY